MKCPLCKKNFTLQESSYTFFCKICLVKFSNLKSGSGAGVKGIQKLRLQNFHKIFLYLKTFNKKTILDIGCSSGLFILLARKYFYKSFGIEPDPSIKKIINVQKYIFNDFFPMKKFFLKKKFDIIIFNDTFEHLDFKDPKLIVAQLKKLLSKKGLICVNCPNYDGFFYKVANYSNKFINIKFFFNRLWQKNMQSPHTVYFNNKSLDLFFKKNNFKKVASYELDTIHPEGLLDRIQSSIMSIFFSKILYFVLNIFCKFKFNTKDIIFNIYQMK
jgi:SAM-dependent methyltransferase